MKFRVTDPPLIRNNDTIEFNEDEYLPFYINPLTIVLLGQIFGIMIF